MANAAARGVVPSNLRESDPLFATLESACPQCEFTGADPVAGIPLRIAIPPSATVHVSERREARLIQSYDFAAADPVSVTDVETSGTRTALSSYEANNAVNAPLPARQ